MSGQSLVVVAIVSAAVAYMARRAWKQLQHTRAKANGKGDCEHCGH